MKEIKSHLEPALGSKENPIVITNENEYNQVHYDLYYSYSCKKCGHECIRKKRSSEKEKVLQRRLLCKNCGLIDTPLWKEGKYDEAVLDVMGLKWDGEEIVEK